MPSRIAVAVAWVLLVGGSLVWGQQPKQGGPAEQGVRAAPNSMAYPADLQRRLLTMPGDEKGQAAFTLLWHKYLGIKIAAHVSKGPSYPGRDPQFDPAVTALQVSNLSPFTVRVLPGDKVPPQTIEPNTVSAPPAGPVRLTAIPYGRPGQVLVDAITELPLCTIEIQPRDAGDLKPLRCAIHVEFGMLGPKIVMCDYRLKPAEAPAQQGVSPNRGLGAYQNHRADRLQQR